MIDSLAKLLVANQIDPDSFSETSEEEGIFRGELPAGRVMETWASLAKAAAETKYWPIIRDSSEELPELNDVDPAAIIAAAPIGNIREILQPRLLERLQSLTEFMPEFAEATDMDQLAKMADASRIFSFGGDEDFNEQWPIERPDADRISLHTRRKMKGKPAPVLLIRVEHSSEVPAYLNFGGWNDCPSPELQIAVLGEWRNEYKAAPVCVTGDVLECLVASPPQTEAQAMKLAAEQWIFCDDIVSQGTQSVRKLAMEIWKAPQWFFWWD